MVQKTDKSFRVVIEACELIEDSFAFVTGEYNDGGKIFKRPT